MMIVFLGPDGSGKTSVIDMVCGKLKDEFDEMNYFHLKFSILSKKSEESSMSEINPQGKPLYNPFLSLFKLVYFVIIYQIGYWLNIKKVFSNRHLLVFDRYYHDLLIDPKRFRYGAPLTWARWISNFIPKSQVFILLDAKAEVLQSRKQEVPFAEMIRQREAYLSFFQNLENGFIINTECPIADSSDEIVKIIHQYRRALKEKRFFSR